MIQNPSDGEFLVVWDDDIVQSALGNSCFQGGIKSFTKKI